MNYWIPSHACCPYSSISTTHILGIYNPQISTDKVYAPVPSSLFFLIYYRCRNFIFFCKILGFQPSNRPLVVCRLVSVFRIRNLTDIWGKTFAFLYLLSASIALRFLHLKKRLWDFLVLLSSSYIHVYYSRQGSQSITNFRLED